MKRVLLIDTITEFSNIILEKLSLLKGISISEKSKPNTIESNLAKKKFDLLIVNLSSKVDVISLFEKYKIQYPIICYSDTYDKVLFDKIRKFNLIAYLPKPFNEYTINSIVETSMLNNVEPIEDDIFYYRKKGKLIPIIKREIDYINTDGNYCILQLEEHKHTLRYPLAKLLDDLAYPMLKRAHRQYAVNITKVSQFDISNNECQVKDEIIPVGRAYKKLLKKSIAGNISSN